MKQVSKIAKENLRDNDTFGRWGGEEFLVLASELTKDQSGFLAERLRLAFENHEFQDLSCPITASFGVAQSDGYHTVSQLISEANRLMYEAKQKGKNLVVSEAD